MRKIIKKINDDLYIKTVQGLKRIKVFVNHNGKEILLANVEKIAEYFWIKTVYDENYIVVYSRGDMSNQIALNVEAAYNIKNESIVDLSDYKTKVLLEYMLISKKGLYVADVLSFINDNDLVISDEDDIQAVATYLTCGNNDISRDEIIEYILKEYPVLANYMNFEGHLSVIEYRKIIEDLGTDILRFHEMPQLIDLTLSEMKRLQSIEGLEEAESLVEQELKTTYRTLVRRK